MDKRKSVYEFVLKAEGLPSEVNQAAVRGDELN